MKARTYALLSASLILTTWAMPPAGFAAETPDASQAPAPVAEPDVAVTDSKVASETITGAFGIPLGQQFEPAMVANVLGEEEQTFKAYGDVMVTGKRYRVEPKEPSEDFQRYALSTTPDGIVYEIYADYAHETEESQCEKTARLAEAFEARFGKPRGKGDRGAWYSFRPPSDLTRSASLYAHRCKAGRYSVAYRDYAARKASATVNEESTEAKESAEADESAESKEPPKQSSAR